MEGSNQITVTRSAWGKLDEGDFEGFTSDEEKIRGEQRDATVGARMEEKYQAIIEKQDEKLQLWMKKENLGISSQNMKSVKKQMK